jgi:Uma2 family endonuclease
MTQGGIVVDMASPAVRHHQYTFADYLALEEASNTKHEFLEGEIYAMAGGTPEHSGLAVAATVALAGQLAGGPCRVFSSDLRVRVRATGLTTYPDVSVFCEALERDPENADTVTNPRLLVEVLSKSTEAYDRGPKLHHYRLIPSLQAIVLISYRQRELEVWQRQSDGSWTSGTFGPGQTASIETPSVRLVVDEIYDAAREPGA